MTAVATAETAGRSPQGTDSARRQAPPGHVTRAAKPTPAQHACVSEPPACSGLAATSTPARPPAIRMRRPGAAADRSASPVTTSQAPAAANATVITHRSVAPTAARALTVPAAALNGRGCTVAAIVHPATSSSGAASAETTPSQGTPRSSFPPGVGGAGAALPPHVVLPIILIRPFRSILVRAVEVVYAVDEALRLIDRYEPPAPCYLEVPPRAAVGHGATEAPRGVLFHRYAIDAEGLIASARIVPPTSQNQASIEDDLRRFVADRLGLDDEQLTRQCEQAIRNYDPCISCSTHFLDLTVDRG